MARFSLHQITSPHQDRILHTATTSAHIHKSNGLERAQIRLKSAIHTRKQTFALHHQQSPMQTKDDLHHFLLRAARRTEYLSQSQLERSHARLHRALEEQNEMLLVRQMEKLKLDDTPKFLQPDLVEQLQAYDALVLARAKTARKKRLILETKRETGGVRKRGRMRGFWREQTPTGLGGEQEMGNDIEKYREEKKGKKEKRVRFADVATVRIIHAIEGESEG